MIKKLWSSAYALFILSTGLWIVTQHLSFVGMIVVGLIAMLVMSRGLFLIQTLTEDNKSMSNTLKDLTERPEDEERISKLW